MILNKTKFYLDLHTKKRYRETNINIREIFWSIVIRSNGLEPNMHNFLPFIYLFYEDDISCSYILFSHMILTFKDIISSLWSSSHSLSLIFIISKEKGNFSRFP